MTAATESLPPEHEVAWAKTFRLVPSRYPPINLFERIADPAEWETLAAIEALTNDRLRDEIGTISAVPPGERISGPGASVIMAAFTHLGFPSRFTDGSFGVYYACDCVDGALAEVVHHQQRFLRRTREAATRIEMRAYIGSFAGSFRDVRGGWPDVHDPDDYAASQRLGTRLRAIGAGAIVYDNVRLPGAANLAAFRPRAVAARAGRRHVVQGAHYVLDWDGERIGRYIEMGAPDWAPVPEAAASAAKAG